MFQVKITKLALSLELLAKVRLTFLSLSNNLFTGVLQQPKTSKDQTKQKIQHKKKTSGCCLLML